MPSALRLADLNAPAVLRELVRTQESDTVERKREADPATLAKVISAFANTTGGWLLLGVDDDGSLAGWMGKGRAHLRDWLRDVLENELDDPLPHFQADTFELDGTRVGVVRVPRSAHAPHFVDSTGEVFERRNGQTRRASNERVRQMRLRSEGAPIQAVTRFDDHEASRDLALALDAPRQSTAMHARAIASIVRVSLIDPSESFSAWVHEPAALMATEAFVRTAPEEMNDRGHDWFEPPQITGPQPTAGGHVASASWDGMIMKKVSAAWDRLGLAGVRLAGTRPDDSGVYYLLSDEVRERWLVIALRYLLTTLEHAAAFGPAAVRWNLYGIRGAEVITMHSGNRVAARGLIPAHYNNMLSLDVTAEIGDTTAERIAATLWLQLERLSGAQAPASN